MIYIQSNKEKTLPHHFDVACALYGAVDLELDYKLVSFEEVQSGRFDSLIKQYCFVGSVEFMREVFKRVGIENVRLSRNSNRTHFAYTVKEIRERVEKGEEWFVKPYEIKLFTGTIVNKWYISCIKDLPEDTVLMAYEPFKSKITSEWRLYVHNHEIVDSRNYSGDFFVSPDMYYAKGVAKNHTSFPCAYTIDVGILENGENVVIEFNDFWSTGNYGMPNDLYVRMLRDRYYEIIRTGK